MSQPKLIVRSAWRESLMELSAIYVVTVVAAAHLLSVHWLVAMVLAPLVMGAALFGVVLSVEVLYTAMVGLDRVGSALGLRKSPLA